MPLSESPRSLKSTGLSRTEREMVLGLVREVGKSDRYLFSPEEERFAFSSLAILGRKADVLDFRIEGCSCKKKRPELARRLVSIRLLSESLRDAIVKANQGLVHSIAHSIQKTFSGRYCVPLQDLAQEGNLGLLRAIKKFDVSYGTRFSTYATWHIRAYITRYIVKKENPLSEPANSYALARLVRVLAEEHRISKGHSPSPAKVAGLLSITEELALALMEGRHRVAVKNADGEADNQMDSLPSADPATPASILEKKQNAQSVHSLLERLPTALSGIICGLYGIGRAPASTSELAKEMKMSKTRVREMEAQAMKILRSAHPQS